MNIPITLIIVIFELGKASTYNTDTSSYRILKSPEENSFFGYSIAAARVNGSLTIWSGSPKHSAGNGINSTAKSGSIYQCKVSVEQKCTKLRFKNVNKSRNDTTSRGDEREAGNSPAKFALPKCSFKNTICGFDIDKPELWLTLNNYIQGEIKKQKHNNQAQRKSCYRDVAKKARLTGPPMFTVDGGLIALNSDQALVYSREQDSPVVNTTLSSQTIKSMAHTTQCLRFCYNAYSLLDGTSLQSIRALRVYKQYENSTMLEKLFEYQGPHDIASRHWNFSEISLHHEKDGFYKLHFEASVTNNRKNPICAAAADIVLSDITVSNVHCQDEAKNTDVLDGEQSIGMSLAVRVEDDETSSLTTCGPFWQQNCGFTKEATGICYEITSNASEPKMIRNPGLKGCVRGKIDIVLLVDQSGSVNQCNFQRVKNWLRNIVKGFTIGPNEQDIGIVVYSNKESTNDVFELGFGGYGNSGDEKKRKMLEGLRKLPYVGGKTFTGVAFKHANDLLWGPRARSDARKMVILMTDGDTTEDDKENLGQQVDISRGKNATILAVGVGNINETELISISGGTKNFFRVANFSQLEQIKDTLRQTVSYSNLEGSKSRRSGSMQNCHMGFSLHRGEDALLMGSPGCFNWVGDVMRYGSQETNELEESGEYSTAGYSYTSSLNTTFNQTTTETMMSAEHTLPSERVFEIPTLDDLHGAFNSTLDEAYLGYAVTSGNFFGEFEGPYIAASAPRLKATGGVIVYKSKRHSYMSNSHVLSGIQLGEYFGASLCAEDVDSDGFTDLLVGAPLHTNVNADEGRVYVFMGRTELLRSPDLILEGSGMPFSRFGLAITAVGDVTMDKYKDIVISAPHEEDGKGAVYVFRGGKGGLHHKYSQRIAASSFDKGVAFRLFGQSVYGGVDVDGNGYQDILVGTPGSDVIVILKTRPVVYIEAKFSIAPPIIDRLNPSCWMKNTSSTENYNKACISSTVCFSYHGKSVPPGIGVQYVISSDMTEVISRIKFHDNNDDSRTIAKDITLWNPNSSACVNHTSYLKENIQDMMTGLKMELTYEMKEYASDNAVVGSSHSDFLAPVLDISTVKTLYTTAWFMTYCEDTASCVADISIKNSGPVSEEGQPVETYEIYDSKLIRFKLELSNAGPEDAHAVTVSFDYPIDLVFSSLTETDCFNKLSQGEKRDYVTGFNSISINLLKKILNPEKKCTGILNFLATPSAISSLKSSVNFYINASTVSKDGRLGDNVEEKVIGLQYKSSFTVTGISQPDSIHGLVVNSSNSTVPASSTLKHVYKIANTGRFTLHNLSVSIQWPICAAQDDAFYYVGYVQTSSCTLNQLNHNICKPVATNNNLLLESNSSICKKTEFTPVKNCKSISVDSCASIPLLISNLSMHEQIFVSVTGEVDLAQFQSLKAQLPLTSVLLITPHHIERLKFPHNQVFEQSIATTIYPAVVQFVDVQVKSFNNLPIWVYIVSIAIGILLLILLILLLRHFGFFESKYAKKKKEAQEDQADDAEQESMNP